MSTLDIPLFPLSSVLFPEGPLQLRIFEPRYLEMVSSCLRGDSPFGVCLIESGQEAGEAAIPFNIGTLARIVDWHQYPDGLLGISALGEERFTIQHQQVQANQLIVASVSVWPPEPPEDLPPEFKSLVSLLETLLGRAGEAYQDLETRFDDASWVGFRLAELLPLPGADKLAWLEVNDSLERLRFIADALQRLARH